jgi:hypothetical protein
MKKWLILSLTLSGFFLAGCMPPSNPNTTATVKVNKSLFSQIYPPPTVFMPRKIQGVKPNDMCPRYIKVWVGSYSDKKGNYHAPHWEWLKIKDCKPQTNF